MKFVHGWAFPDVDQFMAAEMKPDGSYQAGHYHAAVRHVRDRSLAIDCGAHVGTWSKLMSADFDRVIAIEPSPDTFEALVTNLAAFGCANVEPRNVAVGRDTGTVSMVLEGRAAAANNTGGRFVQPGGTIPLQRIDDWHLPSCGFLKMDIEGSEPLALEGAAKTIARCRPVVLFEHKGFCRRYGLPPDATIKVLTRCGYRHAETQGKDQIWIAA